MVVPFDVPLPANLFASNKERLQETNAIAVRLDGKGNEKGWKSKLFCE